MHALNLDKQQKPSQRQSDDVDFSAPLPGMAMDELLSGNHRRDSALVSTVVRFLDRTVPLKGASHGEVASYGVDIPLRYASLFAILTDGRKVRLRDAREFAGWSGWAGKRSFLLRCDSRYLEICIDPVRPIACNAPGDVCDLVIESSAAGEWTSLTRTTNAKSRCRKFIAPDGSRLIAPA